MNQVDQNRIRTLLPIQIGELCLCDLGYEQVSPLYSFGPAVRSYTLLHFVLSGEGTFYADSQAYPVHEGECFLIHPDKVTTYTASGENPWSYFWIGMRGKESNDVISKAFGDRSVTKFDSSALDGFELSQALEEPPFAIGLKTVSLLYNLLSSIYRTGNVCEPQRPDVVRNAVRYIENNYFHPFDVSTLAETLGISRAHFTVLFGSSIGVSPYKYLTNFRLERAAELLGRNPSLTVEEIAYSVGFGSIERFSEMFKKHYGVSPRAYRNNL